MLWTGEYYEYSGLFHLCLLFAAKHSYWIWFLIRKLAQGTSWEKRRPEVFWIFMSQQLLFPPLDYQLPLRCIHESAQTLKSGYSQSPIKRALRSHARIHGVCLKQLLYEAAISSYSTG